MTVSSQEGFRRTWFLGGLFVVAIVLVITALFLRFLRTPDAGPIETVPTATVTTEAGLATMTSRPTTVVEGTASPVPSARRTTSVELTPSSTVELATTATTVAEATVTPTASPLVTPPGVPGGAGDTGTIEGQIALQGRNNRVGITLLVDGTPMDTTDASGTFRLNVPAGRFAVRASYPGHIAIEAPDVEVRVGEVTRLPATSLPAGDADRDGDVDLYDMVRCAIGLGRLVPATGPHADVNGDGVIDLRDIILTQRNYRDASPLPWQ
ncbi:MAG: hypothetical protein ACE5LU_00125 [Anaerolineae bacterium]